MAQLAFDRGWSVSTFDLQASIFEHPHIMVDLAERDDCNRAFTTTAERTGLPNLAVITVGGVSFTRVPDVTPTELRMVVNTNFVAVVTALQGLYQTFAAESATSDCVALVLVSNGAFALRPEQPVYTAMNAAVATLIRNCATDFAHVGIYLVGIAPGTVLVDHNRERVLSRYPEAPYAPDRPGGVILMPNDLATIMLDLVGHARHFTGHTIRVDAGSSI